MTSSLPRRLVRLALLLAALAAVWAALWYGGAMRLKTEVEAALLRLEARGARAACEHPATAGFPFSLTLSCDAAAYARDLDGVSLKAGRLDAQWSLAAPLSVDVALAGPMRAELPGMVPLDLAWTGAEGGLGLWLPRPSRLTLTLEAVAATTGEAGDAEPVFALARLEARADVEGRDVLVDVEAADVRLQPAFTGGVEAPPLALDLRAALKDAAERLIRRKPSLRGATIALEEAKLAAADGAALRLTGTMTVDDAGMVDGDLLVFIDNPGRLAAWWKSAPFELATQAEAVLDAVLALRPSATDGIPLRIEKGEAYIGLLPLGFLAPLR